jgi:hypothetical protein
MAERATFVRGLSQFHGWIGGKPVTGVLSPGNDIPPGEYLFMPPVKDPIYGPIVQMVPVGKRQEHIAWEKSDSFEKGGLTFVKGALNFTKGALNFSKAGTAQTSKPEFSRNSQRPEQWTWSSAERPEQWTWSSERPEQWTWSNSSAPGSHQQWTWSPNASGFSAEKVGLSFMKETDQNFVTARGMQNGSSFILSSTQIPGRNSILVGAGFSDLVERLAMGPVPVTVS